jgi:peptide-methionine (S)-S-oxide reductase
MKNNKKLETAILAGGCFWCLEAVFQKFIGVEKVLSGYIGGEVKNPTYRQICTGTTGHAEAVKILYNPDQISFETLLEIFWEIHDPTSLNRQGADQGTQYRSAIFYLNKNQKEVSLKAIKDLEEKNIYDNKIVTEVTKADTFYEAEGYHQDYYKNNNKQSYCRIVINPKLNKITKKYGERLLD